MSDNKPKMLLDSSVAKEALEAMGVNVEEDALDGLNIWVHWLIKQAAKRAESNGRRRVKAHDFVVV